MSFEKKVAAAHKELEEAGIKKSKFYPPLQRLFRNMGFKIRPYHYNSFWYNFLTAGLMVGTLYALMNWFDPWDDRIYSLSQILIRSLVMGSFLGLVIAFLIRTKTKRLNLTAWNEL